MKVLFRKIFAIVPSYGGGYGYYMQSEEEYNNEKDGEYLILKFMKYEDMDAYEVKEYYVVKKDWKEEWYEVQSWYSPSLEALVFTDWKYIALKEINRIKTYGPVSLMSDFDRLLKCVEKSNNK
jgi:hypothetical protein